ncbi:pentapeptide repeat-containing protein [Streptomyces sp. NPDC088810]|uniref:pentapeptide repeat-containing protein n=1 Tax=Streptomyces sp. NPDC088810 TaxID=3365904 RepID=UPI00381A6188
MGRSKHRRIGSERQYLGLASRLRLREQLNQARLDLSKERAKVEKAKWSRIGAWAQWVVTLATAIALIFTLRHGADELATTREQHVTSRFATAINQVGSKSQEVRVGGVYALARLMLDSPTDQGAIVDVLATFVRDQQRPQANIPSPLGHYFNDLRSDIEGAIVTLQGWCLKNEDCWIREGSSPHSLDLSGVVFGRIYWDYNLPRVNLSESDFTDAYILEADLFGASFVGATMRNISIEKAGLREAVFFNADLSGADIASTDLSKADFREADLRNSLLRDVDFSGAKLDEADLRGADLSRARVSCSQLAKAKMDEKTKVPASCSGIRS